MIEYPSIAFYEIDYSVFTVRQASKRSWRIGQTEPVEVTYFAYAGTMQATALSLVARKLRSALQLEGDRFDAGLAGADEGDDSLLAMLARALRTGERPDDVEQLFADLRQAEAGQRRELVAPGLAVPDGAPDDEPVDGAPLALPTLPAAGEVDAPLSPGAPMATDQSGEPARRPVVGGQAELARPDRGRWRSARPAPAGQLALFDAADAAPEPPAAGGSDGARTTNRRRRA